MNWIILLVLAWLGYIAIKYWEKSAPENKIKRLEQLTDWMFQKVISDLRELIKILTYEIEQESKGNTVSIVPIEDQKQTLKWHLEFKVKILNLKTKVVLLRERNANAPVSERLTVEQYWYKYLETIEDKKSDGFFDSLGEVKDFWGEVENTVQKGKEFKVKINEIEKQLLKNF